MFNGKTVFGIILIIIGGMFLLDRFYVIHYSFRHLISDFWPLTLIIIGVALIIRHSKRLKYSQRVDDFRIHMHGSHSGVFGDSHLDAKDMEIDGFKSSVTFGDTSVNLANAKLKPGNNRIDISSTFGDITIIVPGNMEAIAYATSTFGDLYAFGKTAGGISNRIQNQTEGYDSATSKLNIWASVTFGDVKIYRA